MPSWYLCVPPQCLVFRAALSPSHTEVQWRGFSSQTRRLCGLCRECCQTVSQGPSLLWQLDFLEVVIFPEALPDSFFACDSFSTSVFCCTVKFPQAAQLLVGSEFFLIFFLMIYLQDQLLFGLRKTFIFINGKSICFPRDVYMCRNL